MASQPPVWFITGASSGFGKYLALEALSRGHRVIASARSLSRLADVEDAGADIIILDVTSHLADIADVAKEANDKYGYITHLVNVAGYVLVGAVEETSPEEDFRCFNTNVFGTLNVTKAFIPYLRHTTGHRTISNFGSVTSWYGDSGHAIYGGTNWAVSGITESLREELAPFGIAVTVIEPGWYRTSVLNPGVVVHSEKLLPEYENGELGKLRKMLGEINGKQIGDVAKGCKVLVDVLTMTDVAEGKEVPVRVPLGADAHAIIKGKCESTLKLLGEWDGLTTKTDYE